MLCGKASERDDRGRWMRRIGGGCRVICAKPRVTLIWLPPSGTVRSCQSICVADTGWTLECANASDYFDNWVFGYASRVPKSLNLIR